MTRFLLTLIAAVAACTAQTKPNMTGVWELDKVKSAAVKNLPRRMTLKIEHNGTSISVSTQYLSAGAIQENSATYTIGGTSTGTMHSGPMTSDAAWDGETLVVKSVVKLSQDLVLTDSLSLSADGKTLTFRELSKFGTSPEADSTRFFDKAPDASWDPDAFKKPAEQIFQNIQTFKGVPANRVPVVMNRLTQWLGVDCWHCHVVFQYDKDDKPAKQTARKMFSMVHKINQENGFDGTPNSVTCWTCHRGEAKPQSLPAKK